MPQPGSEPAPLPPARIALRLEAPDVGGPWKMVVSNEGDVPLRFAADGRLLRLEVEPPEDDGADQPYGKAGAKKKAPPPVVCRLPADLRPAGVVESRAVVLGPGARYEEVVSPALYCFAGAEAKALVAGARITAKLGFPDATKASPKTPLRPPFVAEAATSTPTVAPVKEIASDRFVVAAAASAAISRAPDPEPGDDPTAPRLELVGRARIDSGDEKTVTTTLTLKNVGRRTARLHVRRDNLVFDVDGPDGSSQCGMPATRRAVPHDRIETLAPGATRSLEVWIGEMCPNHVFDRPGLYRVRAGLTFPAAIASEGASVWTTTVVTEEPMLVRIRQGRLPFYTSPPQVFGGSSVSARAGGSG